MNDWENELRTALQRREPPRGFAERVLSRVPARRSQAPRWAWAWAVAACLLVSAGGLGFREYRARQAGQDLLLALDIAGRTLQQAEKIVQERYQRTRHE